MRTVKVIIERSKDLYSAYAENVEGIYGAGDTPAEAKKSILKSISLVKKYNKNKQHIPAIQNGPYKIVYRFDAESLLKYYKGIFSNSALEKITGINQKQLQHYSSGLKKPRPVQREKIQVALHQLGNELLAVQL